jgi:hypothetical protein
MSIKERNIQIINRYFNLTNDANNKIFEKKTMEKIWKFGW